MRVGERMGGEVGRARSSDHAKPRSGIHEAADDASSSQVKNIGRREGPFLCSIQEVQV